MSTETRIEYRIMYRRPRSKRFQYAGKASSLDTAIRRARAGMTNAPEGWAYRIDQRTVIVQASSWNTVNAEMVGL